MALTEVAGIFIIVTLSHQSLLLLGESVFTSETDRNEELKATDKRMNNFRVPVETPFDPNFWPARGRRNKHAERLRETDLCDTFPGLRCPGLETSEEPGKRKWPPSEFLPGKASDCNEDGIPVTEPSRVDTGKRPLEIPDMDDSFGPTFDKQRYKKQRHFRLPQLLLYGNGMLWEPGNPYAEKKKKEDVFWVARGKKNFHNRK